MSFCLKMRELRRQKGITQEKLADYLMISPQAVSRWETGNAFPDLSLIAPLCNILGVSSDELLEIDVKSRIEKVQSYTRYFEEWAKTLEKNEQIRKDTITKLREGLRLYPDSLEIKKCLVIVLYVNSEERPNKEEKIELCKLCKELIEEQIAENEKHFYISIFCENARFAGLSNLGKELVELLPSVHYNKMRCLALCSEKNEERKNALLEYIEENWENFRDGVNLLLTECEHTGDEILLLREKLEKVYSILYDNDDVVQYLDFDEFKVAELLYQVGDYDHMVKYLTICLEKWTSVSPINKVSSLRNNKSYNTKTKNEIQAEAQAFVDLVTERFKNILADQRIISLIDRAKSLL